MKTVRTVKKIVTGIKDSDGDAVQLTRLIGSENLKLLDPFLLLDAFNSDKPQDYIGGFPAHPHRGFETVTYMLAGKMRHKDHMGHSGTISAGDVQWMKAGRGVIHSEMPEQKKGLLSGFQLWINLPASHKMDAPDYQEITADKINIEQRDNKCRIKVIAGTTKTGITGVIKNNVVEPLFWDIHLAENGVFNDIIQPHHNAFIYVYEGEISIADISLRDQQLAVLSAGEKVHINAQTASRFLLIAGKPINEPVARGGPFVMNTADEIKQAFRDYKAGKFTEIEISL